MMKRKNILILVSICLMCAFIFSCKNNSNTMDENLANNQKPINSLPDVVEKDSLADEFDVVVVDTFENGAALVVNYCDENNANDIRYEKKFYESGQLLMEGPKNNGRREGKWTAYYENGIIWSVGYYVEGLKHGSSEVFYDNGQVRYTKIYEKDVAEGLWKFFDVSGNLVGEVMYENGKILWQKGVEELAN